MWLHQAVQLLMRTHLDRGKWRSNMHMVCCCQVQRRQRVVSLRFTSGVSQLEKANNPKKKCELPKLCSKPMGNESGRRRRLYSLRASNMTATSTFTVPLTACSHAASTSTQHFILLNVFTEPTPRLVQSEPFLTLKKEAFSAVFAHFRPS